MSRRTADANKAITKAWENEQVHVSEGKGTRDWTPEQQQDILDRGKAYDENGKAFEGQHMRSVAGNPECQGDPNNIQFLTREEHLAAHGGNWQNPTNWYYDPLTKTKHDFGDGPIIPCEIRDLSQPIIDLKNVVFGTTDNNESKSSLVTEDSAPRSPPIQENRRVQSTSMPVQNQPSPHATSFRDDLRELAGYVWSEFKDKAKAAGRYLWRNKWKILGGAAAITAAGVAISNSHDHSESSEDASDNNSDFISTPSIDTDFIIDTMLDLNCTEESDFPETHNSPQEHIVPAHGQHYHTNNGIIWKDKEPYSRGGDHCEE